MCVLECKTRVCEEIIRLNNMNKQTKRYNSGSHGFCISRAHTKKEILTLFIQIGCLAGIDLWPHGYVI